MIKDSKIEKKNASQKPVTVNPGTILDAPITNRALMIKENIPKVNIVIGRVKIVMKGLMNRLITPKTTAKITAPNILVVTPGIKYAAINIEIVEMIQCVMFIIFIL